MTREVEKTGRESLIQLGSRVAIVGPEHPWSGHSGRIVSEFRAAGLDWTVKLDNGDYVGHEVAVSNGDIRPERRSHV